MPSSPVVNPGNVEFGLPDDEDLEETTLEMELEEMIDAMDDMPQVGEAPEDE